MHLNIKHISSNIEHKIYTTLKNCIIGEENGVHNRSINNLSWNNLFHSSEQILSRHDPLRENWTINAEKVT